MRIKKLGPFELQALAFLSRHGGWHSYHADHITICTVRALDRAGLIQHDSDLSMFAALEL